MKSRSSILTIVVFLAALTLRWQVSAQTTSVINGQIAFTQGDPNGAANIFTANPDGSNQQQVPLGDSVELFSNAVWSPDGSKLLISHTFRLDAVGQCCLPFRPAIVSPNGSGYMLLTI